MLLRAAWVLLLPVVLAQEGKERPAKAEGIEFLSKNKVQDGVITLPSGLQYKVCEGS